MPITPYVQSLSGLKQYIKERLGYPVINIEVTDEQMLHSINQTVDKFVEFAEGGVQLRFTTQDIVVGIQEYAMANDMYSIYQIWDSGITHFDTPFPDKLIADIFGEATGSIRKNDLLTLDLTRHYLKTIDFLLKVQVIFDYNPVSKKLYLMEKPLESSTFGIAYYQKIDYNDDDSQIYDHQWIKNYSTALTKKQWAGNLLKYAGSMLPGGLQLNAQDILQEANTEIEKLDEEMDTVWKLPSDFFIG